MIFLFTIKVKTLVLMKWSYTVHPLLMLGSGVKFS